MCGAIGVLHSFAHFVGCLRGTTEAASLGTKGEAQPPLLTTTLSCAARSVHPVRDVESGCPPREVSENPRALRAHWAQEDVRAQETAPLGVSQYQGRHRRCSANLLLRCPHCAHLLKVNFTGSEALQPDSCTLNAVLSEDGSDVNSVEQPTPLQVDQRGKSSPVEFLNIDFDTINAQAGQAQHERIGLGRVIPFGNNAAQSLPECGDDRQQPSHQTFASLQPNILLQLRRTVSGGTRARAPMVRRSVLTTHLARVNVRDYYAFSRLLGSGLSAEVFEGKSLFTGEHVALKVYYSGDQKSVHETITEHVCMNRVQHPHVLACFGLMFDGIRPTLILELARESLRDVLEGHRKKVFAHAPPFSRASSPNQVSESGSSKSPFSSWSSASASLSCGDREEDTETGCSHRAQRCGTPAQSMRASEVLTSRADFPQALIMRFAAAILEACAAVHASGLAHCDIKPENIVLVGTGKAVKLCDFGAAVAIDPKTGKVAAVPSEIQEMQMQMGPELFTSAGDSGNGCAHERQGPGLTPYSLRKVNQGTDSYNAPERSNKADMRKADAWAIGCVIYEMCTGGIPLFNWRNEREKYMQLARVYDDGWEAPRLPAHSGLFQGVVDSLLAVDPHKRQLPELVLSNSIFGSLGYRRKAASSWVAAGRRSLIERELHGTAYRARNSSQSFGTLVQAMTL